MKMMMTLTLLSSINFTKMKHPMAMGMMLLIQTMITIMMSGMMSKTFWMSYILFLIFLGGMMVLFIYVTSIASNEMFKMSTKLTISTLLLSMIIITMNYNYPDMINQETMNLKMTINESTNNMTIKLYNSMNHYIMITLAMYLFITLIAIVKITNTFKGPLRKSS
uniref:NADH dehydrogenase subunit 6 n=1 Tax=Sorineuchora formosana TaxID=3037028 RepID=UPI0027A76C58|nr:NADH dehydrogenase subunit 6 [Sorineuchora formosana]WGO57649.1 NADH dehydrogenase subunit 6 [Sorineuchora formosana]